jgi:hypothetical protein
LTSGWAADSIWAVETRGPDHSAPDHSVPDYSVPDYSVPDYSVEVSAMSWEAPDFIEVKMDAEINSYQDDFDREPDDRF